MKKGRIIITVTSTEEWYNKHVPKVQKEIASGEYRSDIMTPMDVEEGLQDVEIIFEELTL